MTAVRHGWVTALPGGQDYCRTHRDSAADRHPAPAGTDTTSTELGTVTP